MRSRACFLIIGYLLALVVLPGGQAQQSRGRQDISERRAKTDEDSYPEYISIFGNVVHEDGSPPVGAFVELHCGGSMLKEAAVEPNGQFSFRVTERIRLDQDPSQSVIDPFGRVSNVIPFDVGRPRTSASGIPKFTSCELRASLNGYKSSVIELGTAPLSIFNDMGTIVLFPIAKVRGATVAATSQLAPKSAKKDMEKAKAALRRNSLVDVERYLQSAVAFYPKYGEAWFQLGSLYQTQRRFKEARNAYAKAIESDNLFVNPYVSLGILSAAEKRWKDAADLTRRALVLDPAGFPEAYYVNALASFYLKDPVQAEKNARWAQLLDSAHHFYRLHLILASILAGRKDIIGSIEELRKYVRYGPRGALVLQQYGSAPYLDSGWESFDESRRKQIASKAEPEVRLMLAEAFVAGGMTEQAKIELTTYLNLGDVSKVSLSLGSLLRQAPNQDKDESASTPSNEKAGMQGRAPIDYLHYAAPDLPDFEAAADQESLHGILAAVGNNVSRLFANFFNLSATERVQLQKFDQKGKADPIRSLDYLYLCIGAIEKEEPLFDEFRSNAQGQEIPQFGLEEGYMLTAGFISAPLIFHPIHQNGSSFRLLGYQRLEGRNTMVLAYAQIPDRNRLAGRLQIGKETYETFKQGMAWIDMENYQIIRLISDLLQPISRIGLEKLRTEIHFDEVRFDQAKVEFWLPVQVGVTISRNGRVLRNTHTYSNFRLFDVQTLQKIERPKNDGKSHLRTR